MTSERDLDVESRLTALETKVEELKRIVESRANLWLNFFGSTSGGIIVGVVLWWITKK